MTSLPVHTDGGATINQLKLRIFENSHTLAKDRREDENNKKVMGTLWCIDRVILRSFDWSRS